ncbi:hypothetical protein X777_01042 [Ooceraea biroi]|uniref:Uncharacterized protein n=1 Tax=Ooceraea biroi TaxID=2015173 RepID=A0A026VVM6_OOCBI|nr:hypothetical protein X777_01042 [Ooceraea biroi]
MSSKRKSPPTKLSEGGGGAGTVAGANEEEEDTTSPVAGPGAGEAAVVVVGEEGAATPVDIEECYSHQRGGECESSGCSSPATTSEPDLRDSPSPSLNSLRTAKRQRLLLTCKMNSESLSIQDDTTTTTTTNTTTTINTRRTSPPLSSTPTGHNAHSGGATTVANNVALSSPDAGRISNTEAQVQQDGVAALHRVLCGESVAEKERRVSEMILQLQLIREQLLQQQDQPKSIEIDLELQVMEELSSDSKLRNE